MSLKLIATKAYFAASAPSIQGPNFRRGGGANSPEMPLKVLRRLSTRPRCLRRTSSRPNRPKGQGGSETGRVRYRRPRGPDVGRPFEGSGPPKVTGASGTRVVTPAADVKETRRRLEVIACSLSHLPGRCSGSRGHHGSVSPCEPFSDSLEHVQVPPWACEGFPFSGGEPSLSYEANVKVALPPPLPHLYPRFMGSPNRSRV
ncbi:hypothetical protein MRX96_002762 [Rhipicephalus microplus]